MYFNEFSRWFGGEGDGGGRGGRGRGGFGGRGPGGPGGPGGPMRGGPHARPGGFGPWQEMFREFRDRPQRAERGGVRYLVLDAVRETARHGYEIMAVIADRTGGAYKPSPGVIYPTLQMLEELGHVKVTDADGKKVYAITAAGTADLAEHREEVASFYEQSEETSWEDQADHLHDLMHRVRGLLRVFRRAGRRGRLTPDAMAKVRTIFDETLAKLEGVLGRDDERR